MPTSLPVAVTPSAPPTRGQAEVAEVRVVGVAHEHVLWLHVAMNETLRVGRVQGVGDLAQKRERARRVERPFVHQGRERGPRHEPHRQEDAVL